MGLKSTLKRHLPDDCLVFIPKIGISIETTRGISLNQPGLWMFSIELYNIQYLGHFKEMCECLERIDKSTKSPKLGDNLFHKSTHLRCLKCLFRCSQNQPAMLFFAEENRRTGEKQTDGQQIKWHLSGFRPPSQATCHMHTHAYNKKKIFWKNTNKYAPKKRSLLKYKSILYQAGKQLLNKLKLHPVDE